MKRSSATPVGSLRRESAVRVCRSVKINFERQFYVYAIFISLGGRANFVLAFSFQTLNDFGMLKLVVLLVYHLLRSDKDC